MDLVGLLNQLSLNTLIFQLIDPKKQSTFITDLDMNNLYGWAMSEYLPYEGFKWLKNVDEFDIMSINEKSLIRYLLEVDLKYPYELHELHNNIH